MDSVEYHNDATPHLRTKAFTPPVSGFVGVIKCHLSPSLEIAGFRRTLTSQGYVTLNEEQPVSNDGSMQGNKVLAFFALSK